MGRPKGGTNKHYSVEEKLKLIKRYLENEESYRDLEKDTGIERSLITAWVLKYLREGEEGLKPKKKGNPYGWLQRRKPKNELEKYQLENLKLKIEYERLKKECLKKGVDIGKEYETIFDKNTKSSKH